MFFLLNKTKIIWNLHRIAPGARTLRHVATHGRTVQTQGLSQAEVKLLPLEDKDLKDVITHPADVSAGSETDKDLVLHVQTVLRIRIPHQLEDERWPL
jgi:hypothetical protein